MAGQTAVRRNFERCQAAQQCGNILLLLWEQSFCSAPEHSQSDHVRPHRWGIRYRSRDEAFSLWGPGVAVAAASTHTKTSADSTPCPKNAFMIYLSFNAHDAKCREDFTPKERAHDLPSRPPRNHGGPES
ncbi:hypothetical protein AC578_8719 [Pseudocercospora eumusae]|uniref:Uncharacterized protein n=1 Tax=Pseudocercospora eumusae TaxID=321146 RepID=A0A139HPX4_9PEZI|nr:hypothetical protein AC578_8719 [Pseudocercospora eumusae]